MELASAQEWLLLIGLGAVAGAVGQTLRMVIGIKKAKGAGTPTNPVKIEAHKMVVSLMIGAAAGVIAGMLTVDQVIDISREQVLGLVAAGYAGADFIEGAMKRALPT